MYLNSFIPKITIPASRLGLQLFLFIVCHFLIGNDMLLSIRLIKNTMEDKIDVCP